MMHRAIFAALLVAGCAATGPNRYEAEFDAYIRHLTAEVDAGRMTKPQAEYLATRKLNELLEQRRAASVGPVYIPSPNAFQPRPAPQPAAPVSCTFRGNTMTCL